MAVLVEEIINADYAFIIHTTNPSLGDPSEIYAEVVNGETLVGAYPGRAFSFITKKDKLDSPKGCCDGGWQFDLKWQEAIYGGRRCSDKQDNSSDAWLCRYDSHIRW